MTLPSEEMNALLSTRKFLLRLCSSKDTPRVPKAIRAEARRLAKHYPFDMWVEDMYKRPTRHRTRIKGGF